MMRVQDTIDYYNEHAQEYYERTVHADVTSNCWRFAKYVRPEGHIVDVGCGSGRDLRYFQQQGFRVEGIDASEELCRLAREYTGANVTSVRIQDWVPEQRYDGIWANASLLHLTIEEIGAFIVRLPDILAENGVAYMSFKSGIHTGVDAEGRYATDMPRATIFDLIYAVPELEILEYWVTGDSLGRGGFDWLNVIVGVH